MKFEDFFPNRRDIKMLKCLKYHEANLWELHGYLDFPGIDEILVSIRKLKDAHLIIENTLNGVQWYTISPAGKDFLSFNARQIRVRTTKAIIALLGAIASLIAIAEFVLPALLH